MRTIISIILLLFLSSAFSMAQVGDLVIESYFESHQSNVMLSINHGPLEVSFGPFGKAKLFFVTNWDTVSEAYLNEGILSDKTAK